MAEGKRFTGASGAEYEMPAKPALPCTNRRVRVARALKAGQVKHWHFMRPETRDTATWAEITATVAEFVLNGLASYGEKNDVDTSMPHLTPAGEEWLNTYGSTE